MFLYLEEEREEGEFSAEMDKKLIYTVTPGSQDVFQPWKCSWGHFSPFCPQKK